MEKFTRPTASDTDMYKDQATTGEPHGMESKRQIKCGIERDVRFRELEVDLREMIAQPRSEIGSLAEENMLNSEGNTVDGIDGSRN